jgi:hypothetical protein
MEDFPIYQNHNKRCCDLGDFNVANKTNKLPSFIDGYVIDKCGFKGLANG